MLVSSMPLLDKLKLISDKDHHSIIGRGTTGLYLLFKTLLKPGSKVLLPSIVCPHVPFAVILSDCIPVFSDINSYNFNLSFNAVKSIIDENFQIDAIVLIEMFGHSLDNRFEKLLNDKKIHVIYDRAQSIGNKSSLNLPNAHELYSFGYSKHLELGWGGLISTNSAKLLENIEELSKDLKYISKEKLEFLEQNYRNVYYDLIKPNSLDQKIKSVFQNLADQFKDMLLFNANISEKNIFELIDNLESMKKHNRIITNYYHENLSHPLIIRPKLEKNQTVWRYTFLAPEILRGKILLELRKNNIDASSWYPSCAKWFNDVIIWKNLKMSESFEKRVINIWTENKITIEQAEKTVQIILNEVSNYKKTI